MVFPRKLAEGSAFCDRETIRAKLAHNIDNVEHSVIVSPRRYGKTSLVLKVVDDMRLPFAHVDLFLALDATNVIEHFLQGTAQLINSLLTVNAKAVLVLKNFFKSFNISLAVGSVALGITFDAPKKTPASILADTFAGLEAFLQKKGKKAVFFIDEMQDIVHLPVCADVEATIRFFAQKSKYISFIFSGSNRKLLKEIFDDKTRPLWKLCSRINLGRISENHYIDFLQKAAKKKWHVVLPQSTLAEILSLTESHPYYVNYLCAELWRAAKVPSKDRVIDVWALICADEEASLAAMLSNLSDNQKRMLAYTAKQGVWLKPTSAQSLSDLKLTSRGVLQSLKGLVEKDMLEIVQIDGRQGYRVVDPLLKYILLMKSVFWCQISRHNRLT